jgi:hypothetical protein
MKTLINLSLFIIIMQLFSAHAEDWVTVSTSSPIYASTDYIQQKGGTLGVTVWQAPKLKSKSKVSATQCCGSNSTCWCGSIDSLPVYTESYDQYIANKTNSCTINGISGAITDQTQQEVASHENTHVKIHEKIDSIEGKYVDNQYGSIKINLRSSEDESKSSASNLAQIFNQDCSLERSNLCEKYNSQESSSGLDHFEGAGVQDGIWREAACDRENKIFSPIANEQPSAKLPTDSSANCN